MSKMIAFCGHEVDTSASPQAVKITIHNGVHVIYWRVLCAKCEKTYRELGLLLETARAQEDWLRKGKHKTPERYR